MDWQSSVENQRPSYNLPEIMNGREQDWWMEYARDWVYVQFCLRCTFNFGIDTGPHLSMMYHLIKYDVSFNPWEIVWIDLINRVFYDDMMTTSNMID